MGANTMGGESIERRIATLGLIAALVVTCYLATKRSLEPNDVRILIFHFIAHLGLRWSHMDSRSTGVVREALGAEKEEKIAFDRWFKVVKPLVLLVYGLVAVVLAAFFIAFRQARYDSSFYKHEVEYTFAVVVLFSVALPVGLYMMAAQYFQHQRMLVAAKDGSMDIDSAKDLEKGGGVSAHKEQSLPATPTSRPGHVANLEDVPLRFDCSSC